MVRQARCTPHTLGNGAAQFFRRVVAVSCLIHTTYYRGVQYGPCFCGIVYLTSGLNLLTLGSGVIRFTPLISGGFGYGVSKYCLGWNC
jgi:hypothetical protein